MTEFFDWIGKGINLFFTNGYVFVGTLIVAKLAMIAKEYYNAKIGWLKK